MMAVLVRILLIQCMVKNLRAFNIDPSGRVIRDPQSDPESHFGYAVALQINPPRLIVGAPRSYNAEFMGIERPGAVYSCKESSNYLCVPIALEQGSLHDMIELKNDSWIGGALDVSDMDGSIVVCGPRRKREYLLPDYYIPGMCYVSEFSNARKLIPLDEKSYGYYYGYGELGISVHFTPSHELIIGAPGAFHWMGTVVKYSSRGYKYNTEPFIPNTLQNIRPDWKEFSYTGYAVTSGDFLPRQRFYVTSAPRSRNYTGQVLIFLFPNYNDQPMDLVAKLNGTQMGEYFGATLAATDVNGDGIDDLFVGSPLFTTNSSGDMGAVCVYLGQQIWTNEPPLMLFGNNVTGARFGSSIGALADLDQDGFKDVAIGAPYEESGVVYIYRGSRTGLSPHASQRIAASSVASNLRGFGISISRGVDIDGNLYPDLAIGAYESGHVVLLKTLPTVNLITHLRRTFKRISFDGNARFQFETCITYAGRRAPSKLEITTELTVDDFHHRAYVMYSRTLKFRLQPIVLMCKTQLVALRPNDTWRDSRYYGAMSVSVMSHIDGPGLVPTPESKLTDRFNVQIVPTCDKDTCVPKWKLNAQFLNLTGPNGSFVLGSPEPLKIRVAVQNLGDGAFLRGVVVILPAELPLRVTPVHCEGQAQSSNYTCLAASRVGHGEKVELELNLDTLSLKEAKLIEIPFSALSYDSDEETTISAYLNVIRISKMELSSWSHPEVFVLPQEGAEATLSLTLIQGFEVYCTGLSPIPAVRISFAVPKRMLFFGAWRRLLSHVQVKAMLGDNDVNCTRIKDGSRKRRDLLESADVSSVGCGSDDTEECMTAVCVGGPIAAQLNSIILTLSMNLDLTDLALIVDEKRPLLLNSSVKVEVVGESEGVLFGTAGTLLVVPKTVRDEPFLPVYIAVAVVIAIALLAISSYALWKCGFFKRRQIPDSDKQKLGGGEPHAQSEPIASDELFS